MVQICCGANAEIEVWVKRNMCIGDGAEVQRWCRDEEVKRYRVAHSVAEVQRWRGAGVVVVCSKLGTTNPINSVHQVLHLLN